MTTGNRHQHYVPQFYLERFAGQDGYLWVYERKLPSRKARAQRVAHQRDYYSIDAGGERNDEIDAYLQKTESAAAAILRALVDRQRLTDAEWVELRKFVGLLFARVPTSRKHVDRVYGEAAMSRFLSKMEDDKGFAKLFEQTKHRFAPDCRPATAEELRKMLKGGYHFEQDSQHHNLIAMVDVADSAIDPLSRLNWEVTLTDDEPFITSDNPVVTATPDGHGWARYGDWFDKPGVKVLFPLSPSMCLVLAERASMDYLRVRGKHVRCINSAVMCLADRFMYANQSSQRLQKAFDRKGCQSCYADSSFVPVRSEWLM
jgi:Protein of unknown function (DUF4238)